MTSKGGRPAHKPTTASRREVEELVSCGMSEDDVARAIGLTTPTVRKHYADELLTGRARRRAEVIKLLYRNARKGNVSAQRKLEDMTSLAGIARPREAKEPALGKKERAAAEARNPDQATSLGGLMMRRASGKLLN